MTARMKVDSARLDGIPSTRTYGGSAPRTTLAIILGPSCVVAWGPFSRQLRLERPLTAVFGIRGIADAGVDPRAVVEDAAGVGEGLEAPAPVILPHPGVADPAEWQFRYQRVQGAVVDDRIAGFGHAQDLVGDVVVFGEDIQAERVRVAVHPVDYALHGADFEDGQDGAEHLFLHDRRVPGNVDQHRRGDVEVI